MSAKDLIIKPIAAKDARAFIKRYHYSGKVVNNSNLHFGVFWENRLEGVIQYGSPFMKKQVLGLVRDSGWSEMLELNRMAFSDVLPRNSESRALSVSFKLIKKHYPHIKWLLSFSDATQSGDGTIYRASGFVLTQINKNKTILKLENGDIVSNMTFTKGRHILKQRGSAGNPPGAKPVDGFQLRYIYFIDKAYRKRLTIPEIPFSKIDEMGAGMYKGEKRLKQAMAVQQHSGGVAPT